mgnify:FL=1
MRRVMSKTNRQYDSRTAISIVIANMVGTGVFTSLGFQLLDIQSAPVIIFLWLLGGLAALCGALCYSELSVALPRSGGEYNFISSIYHPGLGFVSGWLSATIGFAAPTALVAITSGTYLQAIYPSVPVKPFAIGLVVVISLFHFFNRTSSRNFQVFFTGSKVFLICVFIVGALFLSEQFQDVRWIPQESDLSMVGNGSFAIALIYVSYAYTGWNAATYLAGEIKHVQSEMPKILVVGTLVVTFLYILLHVVFLLVAPMDAMQGKLEVGYVAASYAFGGEAGRWFSMMLSVLLISTASAMILSGPRTLQRIGQDFALLSFLSKENEAGIPQSAILFQLALTIILIWTSSFEAILMFSGFALGLNTLMTVLGVWYLRRYHPSIERPFEVPWYPWPMIIFVGLMLWTLIYVVIERPLEGLLALALVIAGWCFYLVSQQWEIQK